MFLTLVCHHHTRVRNLKHKQPSNLSGSLRFAPAKDINKGDIKTDNDLTNMKIGGFSQLCTTCFAMFYTYSSWLSPLYLFLPPGSLLYISPCLLAHWGLFLNPSFVGCGDITCNHRGGITFNTFNQINTQTILNIHPLVCLDIYYFSFASDLHFFQIFIYPEDDEFPGEMLWTNKNNLSRTEWKLLLDIKIFVRVKCKAESKHLRVIKV